MPYGPGPTPPGGYDPHNHYGCPPTGGPPVGYPPVASPGSYPHGSYGSHPAAAVPPTVPAPGAMQPGLAPGYRPYPGGPGYPPPTNNGLKIALIALVAILVLGGAGVGTYFLLQKDDKPTAFTAAPTPQTDNGKEDKQGEQQGGGQDRDQRDDSEESPNPYSDVDDNQTTPTPNIDPDNEAPTTGTGNAGLPTSKLFLPLPRDVAPSSVGDYEASFTAETAVYRHQTNSSDFLVRWAKASNADIEQKMQLRRDVANFGDIRCGEIVMMACFAPHPRHPDVWFEVAGLGESAEDTSAFTQLLLEKLP